MRPSVRSAPRVSPLRRRGCLCCWSTARRLPFIPSRRRHIYTRAPAPAGGAARPAPAPRRPRGRPARRPPREREAAKGGRRPLGRGEPRGRRGRGGGVGDGVPAPRAEWYGRAREPTDADILIWDTSCVRGGVTDGKRSRLQPSAAGGARDGTARPPHPPTPLPSPTRGETRAGGPGAPTLPPRAPVTLSPRGERRGRWWGGSGGTAARRGPRAALPPSKVLRGRRQSRAGRPGGRGLCNSQVKPRHRAWAREAAGAGCGEPDLPPSLQRGTRYVGTIRLSITYAE